MNPVYLMAGGNWRNRRQPDPGLVAGLKLTARTSPSVAYIGAANGDDASFFSWFRSLAAAAGAGAVTMAPVCGQRANTDRTRSALEKADSIFVAGGDVEAGMRALDDASLCDFLRDLHKAGKPFLGMSAGSIMLGTWWVRWPDEADDLRTESFACLGIAPVCCDTHGESDDWEELHALLRLCDTGTNGYGIPTGCTLVAHPDGSVEALAGPVHRFQTTSRAVRRLPDIVPV